MAFYWVGWGLEIVPKKNYLPYLIHFGVISQRTYVATFLSLHYMDLTIASKKMLAR